jgi:hypothetical protein
MTGRSAAADAHTRLGHGTRDAQAGAAGAEGVDEALFAEIAPAVVAVVGSHVEGVAAAPPVDIRLVFVDLGGPTPVHEGENAQ